MKRSFFAAFVWMIAIWGFPVQGQAEHQRAPELLITEISPEGKSYEYIELYNNTNKALHLRDYNIRYLSMNQSLQIWDFNESVKVEPKSTLIVWLYDSHSKPLLATEEFNRHYKTAVQKNQLTRLKGTLSNIGKHTVVLATDSGAVISYAQYEKGNTHYRPTGNHKQVKPLKGRKEPTPGALAKEQRPISQAERWIAPAPRILQLDKLEELSERTDATFEIEIESDQLIKRAEVIYKRGQDKSFSRANMMMKTTTSFLSTLSRYELYGADPTFEYYFEVSDGQHVVRYPEQGVLTLKVGNPDVYRPFKPGLSVPNHASMKGTQKLQIHKKEAADPLTLTLDYQKMKTQQILSRPAAFVFEGIGVDERNKNAIYIGDHLITHLKPTEGKYKPYELAINPEFIKPGKNYLSIHSGSAKEPYRTGNVSGEDLDHFTVRNIKLLLGDGTILRPTGVKEIMADDEEVRSPYFDRDELKFGSGEAYIRLFEFDVPKELFTTEQAEIDTTNYADGPHLIKASGYSTSHTAEIIFDNKAPELKSIAPEQGKTYKGTFTIDAEAVDEHSSVASVKAFLDGSEIQLPYTASSGKLSKGVHIVKFLSVDEAGNRSKKTIRFKVVDETPIIQGNMEPSDGATDIPLSPKLSIGVKDPTNDRIITKFYRGNRYDFAAVIDQQPLAFSNVADEEPPPVRIVPREKAVQKADKIAVAKVDGTYWVTDSNKGFPYQRYEIPIQEQNASIKQAEIQWVGHSLPGRKVTLYAWNHEKQRWDALTFGYGEHDFTLKAKVDIERYVRDHKIQVLVQDRIVEEVNRPFQFIWMSDTQYYTESFPHIFPVMNNWIRIQNQLGNAEYVVHSGDIVNIRWSEDEWKVAHKSMKILDHAQVPYGVVAGNHDVGNVVLDYRNFAKYFGKKRFKQKPHYGGGLADNTHHYDLASFGGHDFLFLYLGWGKETKPETIKWVRQVLKSYPERNVVLTVHSYLDHKGRHTYTGKQIFKKIVKDHENIKLVLAGHIPGASRQVRKVPLKDDSKKQRTVYEILADYQSGPEGGQGYMRILQFQPEKNRLSVKTYSPYLDDYNYFEPEKDEFVFDDFYLNPVHKQVATDYIGVHVFTKTQLGKDQAGGRDRKASIKLKHLPRGKDLYWYVEVSDPYGGWSRSPVWKFTTKK